MKIYFYRSQGEIYRFLPIIPYLNTLKTKNAQSPPLKFNISFVLQASQLYLGKILTENVDRKRYSKRKVVENSKNHPKMSLFDPFLALFGNYQCPLFGFESDTVGEGAQCTAVCWKYAIPPKKDAIFGHFWLFFDTLLMIQPPQIASNQQPILCLCK